MNPGDTTRPAIASSRCAAPMRCGATAAMRSPSRATSATKRGAPVPSTTSPPRRIRSNILPSWFGGVLAQWSRLGTFPNPVALVGPQASQRLLRPVGPEDFHFVGHLGAPESESDRQLALGAVRG